MDDLQARLEALDKAARTADCYQSAMEARRAFSVALADAYRANELVPASALAEAVKGHDYYAEQHTERCMQLVKAQAEISRLREGIESAWKQAGRMRHANQRVGPYPNDRAKTAVWVRSLYHEGRDLAGILKPYRAALGDAS